MDALKRSLAAEEPQTRPRGKTDAAAKRSQNTRPPNGRLRGHIDAAKFPRPMSS